MPAHSTPLRQVAELKRPSPVWIALVGSGAGVSCRAFGGGVQACSSAMGGAACEMAVGPVLGSPVTCQRTTSLPPPELFRFSTRYSGKVGLSGRTGNTPNTLASTKRSGVGSDAPMAISVFDTTSTSSCR